MDPDPDPLRHIANNAMNGALPDAIFYLMSAMTLVFFLLGSALISGTEVAFFALSKKDYLSNKKHDTRIAALLKRPEQLLATILVLNNLLNISFVTLSTYVCWRLVGTSEPRSIVLIILTVVVTTTIVLFGEIIPKVYAAQYPLAYARKVAYPIYVLNALLGPFTGLFRWIHAFIRRGVHHRGFDYSSAALTEALEIAAEGESTRNEKGMLRGIMNLSSMQVQEVMCARMDIVAIEKKAPLRDLLERINASGFSRFPVYRDSIDQIEGMLYTKDLLPYVEKEDTFEWSRLIRKAYFVPEGRKIGDLFKDFQRKRIHVAVVVDEYGGTSGLVTMEDVIEEIVGNIEDESDVSQKANYKKLDDKIYEFEAKISLNELCKLLNLPYTFFNDARGESNSLGGLILELHGHLPSAGDKLSYKGLTFKIQKVESKRIERVRTEIGNIAAHLD